ncbi:hypothetical protein FH972_000628 [Carpinus fangiana]|uniref:SAP30-binding protein n=1 Tax=Carpinus fangiana TaxID=176857 RepID=A0A5N6Q9M7_9ROSI|nr:hypothetical protein FH972_000628 [Carpinus fangiana]KAE7995864.1 hypothetical protein FH972_000628 [Carpinus fangiana]KAE7995865.1 hypothetical protein FH972_000628 [Carpinus fangiana]
MASKKKQFEGIAMLSMYDDDDEEEEGEYMEDVEEQQQLEEEDEKTERQEAEREQQDDDYMDSRMAEQDDSLANSGDRIGSDSAYDDMPPIASENTALHSRVMAVSPQQEAIAASESARMSGRRKLTIVDYGHDEVAMSPEPEEGEIEGSGRVMFGLELQTANGHSQEKTPTGTVQALTSSNPVTPLSSDPSRHDTMNYAVHESEGAHVEEAVMEQEEEIDPLEVCLPPPPKEKCSEELQRKINKFLDYKKYGKSFNAEVRNRKDYRNPDFLLHAVRYQDIDQIGSCFSRDVFDPHGYDNSDYYDQIEADMRREELEKKKIKAEFASGGTQSGTVATAPKVNMPIPGVSTVAATGLLPVPPAADTTTRDGRQNKKSKWDKVDGDRRNSLPSGGQDSISAAGAHAALLSANAGTGYMAFAQQRRREAEEKKSSGRKVERRS